MLNTLTLLTTINTTDRLIGNFLCSITDREYFRTKTHLMSAQKHRPLLVALSCVIVALVSVERYLTLLNTTSSNLLFYWFVERSTLFHFDEPYKATFHCSSIDREQFRPYVALHLIHLIGV